MNGTECPYCGLKYENLRTGLTFAEVRRMMWINSDDSADWVYKRRHGVLGFWHQIKLSMWTEHLELCSAETIQEANYEDINCL